MATIEVTLRDDERHVLDLCAESRYLLELGSTPWMRWKVKSSVSNSRHSLKSAMPKLSTWNFQISRLAKNG